MPQEPRLRNPSLDGGRTNFQFLCMSAKKETAEARKLRLAKALKANIAKRKAQSKERQAAAKPQKD